MSAMPVKYLSQEWIDQYNAALAGDDAVRAALKGKSAALQMVISGAPQGDVRYWLRIADGGASAGLGDIDGADVTISQSYETSAQVNKGELDGQKAFMQGKVKIAGKMLKMMQLRGPLEKVQTALNTIDTEY
jgi:putative sterol carrier protein